MQFQDSMDNSEPNAHAAGIAAVLVQADKRLENPLPVGGLDAISVISNTNTDRIFVTDNIKCDFTFGRKNRMGDAVEMVEWYKDHTAKLDSKVLQDNPDLIERGVFVEKEMPEYCNEYDKIVAKATGGGS